MKRVWNHQSTKWDYFHFPLTFPELNTCGKQFWGDFVRINEYMYGSVNVENF